MVRMVRVFDDAETAPPLCWTLMLDRAVHHFLFSPSFLGIQVMDQAIMQPVNLLTQGSSQFHFLTHAINQFYKKIINTFGFLKIREGNHFYSKIFQSLSCGISGFNRICAAMLFHVSHMFTEIHCPAFILFHPTCPLPGHFPPQLLKM